MLNEALNLPSSLPSHSTSVQTKKLALAQIWLDASSPLEAWLESLESVAGVLWPQQSAPDPTSLGLSSPPGREELPRSR